MPAGSSTFWLVLVALIGMLLMNAVYWVFIHRLNKVWVAAQPLGTAGARFFAAGGGKAPSGDWQQLRARWEYAHAARAVLTSVSFLALLVALVAPR